MNLVKSFNFGTKNMILGWCVTQGFVGKHLSLEAILCSPFVSPFTPEVAGGEGGSKRIKTRCYSIAHSVSSFSSFFADSSSVSSI